jgi:chromosome segregation ATPase
MEAAMTIDQITQLGIFVGTVIAAVYTYITSRNTKEKLKPIEARAEQQSVTMKTLKLDTDEVDKRLKELEAENELLKESREARGQEIGELKDELTTVKTLVKELTDDKAKVLHENDELKIKLTKATTEIEKLNIRVITLEAQLNAEKSVGDRVVQPIIDALARLAAPVLVSNVATLPATTDENAA